MQTGSKYRLFSLLLALGMLLGFVATGCSDKDRDGSGKPTPEKKQIVFVYEKDGIGPKVLDKVPANADSIQATALAADGSVIEGGAILNTTVVDEQLEEDGKYYAYTTVNEATDKVIYTFYYSEKDGKNIRAYACTLPGVANLQEGDTVTEDEMIVADISAQCYNAAGQEQDAFQVGDTFQIKVTDGAKDITSDVTLTGYDEKVIKPSADSLAGKFDALSDGETYFDLEYQGVVFRKMGHVIVGNPPVPTLDKLLLCPKDYSVQNGDLYDDKGEVVTDYDSLPANIGTLKAGTYYTFFVAGVYTDASVREMHPSADLVLDCVPEVTVDKFTVKADPDPKEGDSVSITAFKTGGASVLCNTITFKVVKLVSLRVKLAEATIKMLGTVKLEAEAVYSDGTTKPVPDDVAIKWTSSDENVATVDASGLVTGCDGGFGSVTIAVQSADGEYPCSQPCKVTVTPAVGDILTMGKWYDKDDQLNEAITWKVMKIEDGNGDTPKRALLVAEKALDVQKYNTTKTDMTWAACSLRLWLTGSDAQGTDSTFYSTAFTEAEKAKIALTTHDTCNWGGRGAYGTSTQDLVFLLDEKEAKDLYTSYADRRCQCTEYAAKMAMIIDDYCYCWLRSPGNDADGAAFVNSDGDINFSDVNHDYFAVRPALYIAL